MKSKHCYLFSIWIFYSSMLYLHEYVCICIVHTVYENALLVLFSVEY